MSFYISFSLTSLIIDFALIFLINYYYKLHNKKVHYFIILIFLTIPSICWIYYKFSYFKLIFYKIISYFFASIIITNVFDFKKILTIYASLIVMFFSIYGFAEFFINFVKVVFLELFNTKIDTICHFIIVLSLFIYLMILVIWFSNMSNKKEIENFLYKVSFSLFGCHIKINGLLDSGNSLYDTKTGKAVIIVSYSALEKFISRYDYKMLCINNKRYCGIINELSCATVGDKNVTIPIIDIGKIEIEDLDGCKTKTVECVLGLTNENFIEKNDYQCLLHREFI